IKKNKIRKKPTDYYNLTLPRETKNYVPKLLAIKNIMSSPEKYGLNIKDIVNSPYFASVPIPQEIDTELIAEFAEIPMEEFQLLNAQHKRPLMKSSDDFHEVLLPIYSVENFYRNMSIYNKPLVSWQSYEPKSGEKIHHVAKRFGIDTKYLAQINHLST
ncbi:MAG TPA: lytic transglycosylase, partial [Methylophilaceae bacterium]|nr:lytic transglycosylase [Methylophilaceae bacterium]